MLKSYRFVQCVDLFFVCNFYNYHFHYIINIASEIYCGNSKREGEDLHQFKVILLNKMDKERKQFAVSREVDKVPLTLTFFDYVTIQEYPTLEKVYNSF